VARQQARRRTRERVAGIGLAVLGLVVLAVAVFAIRNPRNGSHDAAPPSSSTSTSPAVQPTSSAPRSASPRAVQPTDVVPITAGSSAQMTLAQAQRVPLVVLNNTTITGLADQAAQRFRLSGWRVTSVGNLVNDILSTCAYYDPADPNAEAAANMLKQEFPTIKRVRPKFPQLPAGPIVVVLTPDYAPQ
jgi:hypothetical protein